MDRITDFVDAFVPKNLPKKRKAALKEELSCHILDKKDYYREIGYDENAGIDKAIADFGDSEEINNYIYNEFEELYSERSVFGIMAFIIIAVMNYLCVPLDVWVWSIDSNRNTYPAGAFVSFCMILIVLLMIAFARIKKYRKTLISIGVINTLMACLFIYCAYPQMAVCTLVDNIIYLIDRFTPVSMSRVRNVVYHGYFMIGLWSVFPLFPALYSFIAAVRIKKGTAKSVNKPKKKVSVFVAVYSVLALASSLMQPVGLDYFENYPVWFSIYQNNISEESQQKFDEITIGDSYSDVSGRLNSEGYVTLDSYRNSLDRLKKKQFANALKEFEFTEDYEIRFHPDKLTDGNGFVGLKQENGIITAKGIGNMEKDMYSYIEYGDRFAFGIGSDYGYNIDGMEEYNQSIDLHDAIEYFKSLKTGTSEAEVISRLGEELGTIYTKRFSVEDGKEVSYYRIYCYQKLGSERDYYYKIDSIYIELTFENGKLTKGTKYDKGFLDNKAIVTSENIK